MITCFMFGKYTSESMKEISADRTKKVVILINELGGKVTSMYALLGERDLVFVVDFPDINHAIKASVAMTNLTGIPFSTSPAVTVEEFDAMLAEL
ncbi:MAG: GYD domain-containing protein [Candidatus Neomarinimicrobiota bacterium]